jgi:hypothetical protein
MTRPFARISAITVWTGIALAVFPAIWLGVAAAALMAVAILKFGGCHHPRPLGLLPPVSAGGERMPARWFCSQCGQTWAIGLDRAQPPVPRFQGFDPTKAPQAAKRAAALDQRMRDLAVQRSGMKKHAPAAPRQAPAPAAQPVSIHARRVAG